ncbi:MAG TPA: ribonuclease E/G, partial [Nitrospiria bacterium]|nr:ribonuclease E/G [Nitrospiria bacterium]
DKVYNSFSQALRKDKARTRILRISELGLIEMSRERTREDILRVLCEPCNYCEGRGYTKSPITVCYEVFREIQQAALSSKRKKILVAAHPNVANLMYDEENQGVEDLEKKYRKKIIIKADPGLHIEQYDIVPL